MMGKFVEEALGFRIERADIFEELMLEARWMVVEQIGGEEFRREALATEVAMWRLLTSPQNAWVR